MSALAQALEEYADELDETTPGSGLTYLKELRTAALAQISSGDDIAFVSTTVNNQSFNGEVKLPANELFSLVSEAIRNYKGQAVKRTIPRFSDIPH
jgi:hypothetical protein